MSLPVTTFSWPPVFDFHVIGIPEHAKGHVERYLQKLYKEAPPKTTVCARFNMGFQHEEMNTSTVKNLANYKKLPNPYWSVETVGSAGCVQIARKPFSDYPLITIASPIASRTPITVQNTTVTFPMKGGCDYYADGRVTYLLSKPPRTQETTVDIATGVCIIYQQIADPTGKIYKPEYVFIFNTPDKETLKAAAGSAPAAKRARLGDGA